MIPFNFYVFLFCLLSLSSVKGKTETSSDSKLNPNDNKVVDASEILLTTGDTNEQDKTPNLETNSSNINSGLDQQSVKQEKDEENDDDTNLSSKKCPDVTCTPPPADANLCETMNDPSFNVMGQFFDCCPLWICVRADGSFFTHFGMAGKKLNPTISATMSRSNGGAQQEAMITVSNPNSQFKATAYGFSNSYGNQKPGPFGVSSVFVDRRPPQGPMNSQGQIQQPNGQHQRYPNGQLIRSNIPTIMPIPFPVFQFPIQQQQQSQPSQQSNAYNEMLPSWDMLRARRNSPMNFGAPQQMQQRPSPGNPVQFYRPLQPQFQPYY